VSNIAFAIVRLALGLEVEGKLVGALLKLLADGVVHDGELVEEGRVARLRVEGTLGEAQLHHGADLVAVASLAIMLLDNLEKASVVDVAVLFKLADLVGDIVQLGLEGSQAGGRDFALVRDGSGGGGGSIGIGV
jgi:hypothetical protein